MDLKYNIVFINVSSLRRRRAQKEDNEQTDNGNVTRSVKDEEEDVRMDNSDKSANPMLANIYDFDFDIVSILCSYYKFYIIIIRLSTCSDV